MYLKNKEIRVCRERWVQAFKKTLVLISDVKGINTITLHENYVNIDV